MNKADKDRILDKLDTLLQSLGASKESKLSDLLSTERNRRPRWTLDTPYGPVEVGYHEPLSRKGSPWLHCRLKAWDAPQGVFNWFGWKHWKQNFQSYDTTPEEFVARVEEHLGRFSRDKGQGFPGEDEIEAALERKRQWAAHLASFVTRYHGVDVTSKPDRSRTAFVCGECGHTAGHLTGIKIHITKKHGKEKVA